MLFIVEISTCQVAIWRPPSGPLCQPRPWYSQDRISWHWYALKWTRFSLHACSLAHFTKQRATLWSGKLHENVFGASANAADAQTNATAGIRICEWAPSLNRIAAVGCLANIQVVTWGLREDIVHESWGRTVDEWWMMMMMMMIADAENYAGPRKRNAVV